MRDGATERLPVVGAVVLATDLTTERDIRALAPADVAVCATRIPYRNPTTPQNLRAVLPHLGAAAGLIAPGLGLAAIYFSCTSASVVLGEDAVAAAIAATRPGVPVITPIGAAERAFAALGVRRIGLLTPYLAETAAAVAAHLEAAGLEVVARHHMGFADDRDMAALADEVIVAAARRVAVAEAEALFLSCTALPAVALVPRLEAELGRPVVSSNLAGLWQALALAGRPAVGAARLLAREVVA